jgi:hypothetical protein
MFTIPYALFLICIVAIIRSYVPRKKTKFTTFCGGQQVPLRETLIYTVTQFVKYAYSRQSNVPVATNIEARACYTSGRFDLYVQFQRQRPVILFDSFALILKK